VKIVIPPEIECHRITHPMYGRGYGNNGCFVFQRPQLTVITSDGGRWDHASVSRPDHKTPTWGEMCFVKDTFFNVDEWVIQYHPAKKDYIDYGRNVLHLWRPQNIEIPKPPSDMV
jgi:hypothetical protein